MARTRVEIPSVDKILSVSAPIASFSNQFVDSCSPSVKFIIGPEEKIYTIPKDLLCHYSPYFVACFNGGFREGV